MIYSLKKDGDKQITPHFKVREFACKDGSDEIIVSNELVSKLELLRMEIGRAITITSGYRSDSYNKKVGGAYNSYHKRGMAVDIVANGYTPSRLAVRAAQLGFNGIGIYKNFTHIDIRENSYVWEGGNE